MSFGAGHQLKGGPAIVAGPLHRRIRHHVGNQGDSKVLRKSDPSRLQSLVFLPTKDGA